jgi:hypothetical protein
MRGNERTQGRLTRLREIGEVVAGERSDVDLVHIGGTRDQDGVKRKEFYAENPLREQLGIKTIAGSAFADLTFQDRGTKQLYHISLYRVSSGTNPLKEEADQAIKLAVNTQGETQVIVMVPNVRGDDFVDEEPLRGKRTRRCVLAGDISREGLFSSASVALAAARADSKRSVSDIPYVLAGRAPASEVQPWGSSWTRHWQASNI